MFKRYISMLFVAVSVLGASLAQVRDSEQFLLTFIPNIQFAPLYVSIEQGFFEDVVGDLQVDYLNEPDVVDLIASGNANFGVVSGEQVLLSSAQGREIQYIYNWFQGYPIGVVVDSASDIQTPKDLEGVVVGLPGRFGANYSGFTAMLLANDMTEDDVLLEEIGFNAPEAFCLGRVQAAVVYSNNEPLQIRNRALAGECGDISDVRVLPVDDYASLVSNGLVTSNTLVAEDAEYVQAFVGAWHLGVVTTIQNPAQAYLDSLNHVENLPINDELRAELVRLSEAQAEFLATEPDREAIAESRVAMDEELHAQFDSQTLLQWDVLLATIALWDAEEVGISVLETWDTMQSTLLAMGLLEGEGDTTTLYTNDFVPSNDNE